MEGGPLRFAWRVVLRGEQSVAIFINIHCLHSASVASLALSCLFFIGGLECFASGSGVFRVGVCV